MNIINLTDKLLNNKWAMEKRSLYNFYSSIQNLNTLRVGGLRGMLFGNPAQLIKNESSNITQPPSDLESGDSAVISISGILTKGASKEEQEILGLCNTDEISDALDDIANDPTISSIILTFNSPGGETCGIAELGRKIKNIDENIKPVYSFTDTHMASAAAWLGTQARYIGMTESAQIGSCGVYMLVLNAKEKYRQEGIEVQAISSGKYKMLGHDFEPLKPDERELLQQDVNDQHEAFKEVVRANRPDIKDEALEGLSYEGMDALEIGWTDCVVDSFEEFIQKINEYRI